jgi:DNA repair exonuclease SbcCD nuclease subunit
MYTDVPIIAIPGTHERMAIGRENALQLLALAGLLVDVSEATAVIEKDGEKVAVFGLGGISEERVKERLGELDPKPVDGAFNIFMFHQSTHELLPFNDDFIHNDDLPKGFDLYVDGHIHSRVEMKVHGKDFLIPGSTVLTQLKDGEQEPKGFIVYDTVARTHTFVPIESRRFVVKRIKFSNARPEEVSRKVTEAIESELHAGEVPIIKVCLEGDVAVGFNTSDMNIGILTRRYSDKAYIDVDSSKLVDKELEGEIEALRENKIENMGVREVGLGLLSARLKELKFDEGIDVSELFNILSSEEKKEKIIEMAQELISD